MQLTFSGGDWQYLYAIPEKNIEKVYKIAKEVDWQITVIGNIIENNLIVTKTLENEFKILNRIENDRFSKLSGKSFFEILEKDIDCFGKKISEEEIW